MTRPPRIVHFLGGIDDSFGGPAVAVPSLARALAELGVTSEILAIRRAAEEHNAVLASGGIPVRRFRPLLGGRINYAPTLAGALRRAAGEHGPGLVFHIHSLWQYPAYAILRAGRRLGVPIVTSPRSNLYPESLRRSAGPKRVARLLFVDRLLRRSACLHATEEGEVAAIRALGFETPVALVPNGVDVRRFDLAIDRRAARRALGLPEQASYLLFLSRLHPRKGVDLLARVWRHLAPRFPDWQLLLAGPIDDPGYFEGIRRGLEGGPAAHRVRYLGMLRDEKVALAYKAADLFVLPSKFENFGNAVAEALASGLPVVTTRGTPWGRIEEVGAGAWIELGEATLSTTLERLMALDEAERRAMGLAGRRLVQEMSWSGVATKMLAVYEWALDRHPCDVPRPPTACEVLRFASRA